MVCSYAGVAWEDVQYEVRQRPRAPWASSESRGGWISSEWERRDKPDLLERNAFASLPYVVNHSTGEVVAQSSAVSLYLGRVLGLGGATRAAELANEHVLSYVHTMWTEVRDLVYPFYRNKDEEAFEQSLQTYFGATLPDHYCKLERWLRQRGTGFFAGWRPCVADFYVWELLDQHEAMASAYSFASPLATFPLLRKHHARIQALPRLRTYFASEDAALPINNKMAFFK